MTFFTQTKGLQMQIANESAVAIHYILTNNAGEQLDSSVDTEPLVYLHGQGNIIVGLENALTGKSSGDKFNVTVPAVEAYGDYYPEMVQIVSRSMFEGIGDIEVGLMFHADISHGTGVVTIIKIDGDEITIDGNHPLAGEDLTFAVEVVDVRPATADELAHGHVHGAGCQH
jgi:FKBP-type peptidyl-prolyl cis-trans isomerase SlyD